MPETNVARIQLRAATAVDARRLWEWRNDEDARRASIDTTPVPWEKHVEWLARLLADANTRLLVLEVDGAPAGQARLDLLEAGADAELSFAIAPEFRGRGLAAPLIRTATAFACSELGANAVTAIVRVENVRSLRAFANADFMRTGEEFVQGARCYRFRHDCYRSGG